MSNLLSIIVKTLDNLIILNNENISIIFDANKKIWFSIRDVFNALGYKDIKKEIKRIDIDKKHITTYGKIYINNKIDDTKYNKKHPHTVMVDEAGIYILLNKSTKPIANQFRDELFSNILPEYRKTGDIKSNTTEKLKLKKLTKKLQLIQKEQSIKRLTTKKYNNLTGKGFVYVLKVKTLRDGRENNCLKLGYATNLNKRLQTYKTGHPNIELVHQENVNVSKKGLEKCVLSLNIMKRLSSKNEIICDTTLEKIKQEISECQKLIKKFNY